jgi:RHS repeat-associated protein
MARNTLRALSAGLLLLCAQAHAAVAITPPNLAGATAGSLPGAVTVTPKGSASYSVQLAVPPGTAGIAPTVTLDYDSQAGMDMLGLGWKVGGQSQITRCGKTVAVDGVTRAVTLDAEDPFCLDGQRLIKVSGTHGATAEYRTEIDYRSRIKSAGNDPSKGPDSWTVETKDGRILSYGNTAGSLFVAPGKTVRLTWALARAEDRYGNYISYQYVDSDATGEFYLSRIRYTGNDAASPALVPYTSINFLYEDRPDPWQGYVMDSKLQRLKRLTNIQVRTNTAADGAGGTFKRQLTIDYTTSATSKRSLVNSISDCDAGGNCLPATTFGYSQRQASANTFNAPGSGVWTGGPAGIVINEPAAVYGTPSQQLQKKVLSLDVDGDGQTDLLYSTGNGIWQVCKSTGSAFPCSNWTGPAVASEAVVSGDFNRDGRGDLAVPASNIDGNPGIWTVCLSMGTAFNCSDTTAPSFGRTNPNRYRIADFTGDGRDDLIVIGQQEFNEVTSLCPSNGVGFDACAPYEQAYAFGAKFTDPDFKQRIIPLQADFNADGRMDVFKFMTNQYIPRYGSYDTYLAGDAGFSQSDHVPGTLPYAPNPKGFVDVNQDGYPDVLNGSAVALEDGSIVYLAETCLFAGAQLNCLSWSVTDGDRRLAVNGVAGNYDGTDLISVTSGSWDNAVYHGGIYHVAPTGEHRDFEAWENVPVGTDDDASLQSVDVNGDGLPDAIRYNRVTKQWSVYLTGSGSHPDLLNKVTNGYGHDTVVEYKGLYDSTVYTMGSAVSWPKRNMALGAPVVSQLRVEAVSGETANQWLDTTYTYTGLRSHMEGRGSLGFETVSATDQQTHVTTKTTYSQDFPTTGMPTSVVATHSNGTVLSQTTNTLASFATVTGASYPYVRVSTVARKDLDGSALPTVVTRVGTSTSNTDGIDIYGNVTKLQESVTDGSDVFSTVSDSLFSNNTTAWLIGRRTDATITKTAPSVSGVTRKLHTDFDTKGLPSDDYVEKGTQALELRTHYTRDGIYGVITKKTQYWYDPQAVASKQRDIETLVFDAKNRYPETVTNAKSQSETRAYDEATGNIKSLTGPNSLTTTWTYDGWGRKTREDRADATATTWAYRKCVDTCGYGGTAVAVTVTQQWAKVNSVDEQTTVPVETFFDALGREVFSRSWSYQAEWIVADKVYDADGRLRMTSRAQTWSDRNANPKRMGWTIYTRDDLGRATKIETTNALGTGYDATTIDYSGQTTTTTNARSQIRTEVLNGLGKLKSVTDAASKTTNYLYDPWGNLKQTTDPLGNQIVVTYDTLGRKTQLDDPDLGVWNYKVNPLGQTYEQTDAKAQKTTFTFDALGRLTDRVEADQQSHWVFDTATKGVGKLAEAYTGPSTAKDYQRIHSYDSLGRASKVITRLDWDYSTIYAYDTYSRVSSLTHVRNTIGVTGGTSDQTYNLTYNNQGAVYQVKRDTTLMWTRNSQDALGRNLKETFASGLVTQRGFNSYTARVESIETGTVDANGVFSPRYQDDAYTYDSLGNLLTRSQLVANAGAVVKDTFTYDNLNRLKTAQVNSGTAETMGYDELGNISSKPSVGSYSYNPSGVSSVRPHAVSGITGTVAGLTNPSFSYDANGNLKLGLNRGYQWSAGNYPIKLDELTDGTLASATERTEFTYGPDRQRTKQIVRAMNGQTEGAVTRTVYYGGAIEKEVDVAQGKTFIRSYLPEGLGYTQETFNSTSPAVGAVADSVATRYFHKDHLGSPTVITDYAGVQQARLSYDAWGRRRYPGGTNDSWSSLGTLANNQDNTGYTGEEQLDQIGLVHLNGRVYDPITARMVSADPTVPDASDLQQWNRYSYATNSPLVYSDPSGFDTSDCTDGSCTQTVTVIASVKGNAVYAPAASALAWSTGSGSGGGGFSVRAFFARAQLTPLQAYAVLSGFALKFIKDHDDGTIPLIPAENAFQQAILQAGADQGKKPENAADAGVGADTAGAGGAAPPPDGDGPNSKYDRATKGRSVENRSTDVGQSEFKQNLRDNGWKESTSKDGQTTIFEKDGARYVVRDNAKSTGGPTADYYQSGSSSINVKIRLGGP